MKVGWGESATHTKILVHDKNYCDELYSGVHSEMLFAAYYWLDSQYIKFDPTIDMTRLRKDWTGRKRERSGGLGKTGIPLYRIESKKIYKSRTGVSPDYGDAVMQLLHLCRMKSDGDKPRFVKPKPVWTPKPAAQDFGNIKPIDWSADE
jgi:hypothetical protein